MGSKPAITRDQILDVAYARAQRDGMASLGIRTVAKECGVATGTIYNYFPDKASLVTEVVVRFWRQAMENAHNSPAVAAVPGTAEEAAGEHRALLVHCATLSAHLCSSLSAFRAGWLRESATLDARSREQTHQAERVCFGQIVQGIQAAIDADASIVPAARERFEAADLAEFIWDAMFSAIKAGDPSCKTLLALLERALY